MIRTIPEGERLRWYEGIAWLRFDLRAAVVAPLGLHKVLAIARQAYRDFQMEVRQPHAYDRAYLDGYLAGQQAANEREVRPRVDEEE